jgi:hypothetical protein
MTMSKSELERDGCLSVGRLVVLCNCRECVVHSVGRGEIWLREANKYLRIWKAVAVPHLNVKQSGTAAHCEPWPSYRGVARTSLNLRHWMVWPVALSRRWDVWYTLRKGLGGLQRRNEHGAEEKLSCPCRKPNADSPAVEPATSH